MSTSRLMSFMGEAGFYKGMSFDEFFEVLMGLGVYYNTHITHQSSLCERVKVDYLIPLERLTEAWEKIVMPILPEAHPLGNANATESIDWKTFVSPEQQAALNELYASDVELYAKAQETVI
jgi:hypothetical protein